MQLFVQHDYFCFLDPRLVEFVRARKSQSVPGPAPSSKHPEEKSCKEDPPLENVSQESSSAHVLFQKPQEVEMEEGEEKAVAPPPSVTGMIYSKELILLLTRPLQLLLSAADAEANQQQLIYDRFLSIKRLLVVLLWNLCHLTLLVVLRKYMLIV